jgi:rhodanese-related sulfurtransferase
MIKRRSGMFITGVLIFVLSGCFQQWVGNVKVPRLTKEELKLMVGNPDTFIIDVRLADEWKKSEWKIQGAVREDPEKDFKNWAEKYPKDKTLIFYCA